MKNVIPFLCKIGLHKWGSWLDKETRHTSKPGAKEKFDHTCMACQKFCAGCGKNSELQFSSRCPAKHLT